MATGHLQDCFCTAEMPSHGALTDTRFKKIFVTVNPPDEFDGSCTLIDSPKGFQVCFRNKTVREALESLFDPKELIEVRYRDKDFPDDGYAIMHPVGLEKFEATDFLEEDPSLIVAGSPKMLFLPSLHA